MRYLLPVLLMIIFVLPASGQKHKKYARQGNRDYNEKVYDNSEIQYRRSLDENPAFDAASFNLGDALYKQEKYEEASERFKELSEKEMNVTNASASYYNLGNSLLKSEKIEESIDAYKESLRRNPDNMMAKYNLAYAQDLLQQQQEQEQNKDNQENKDGEQSDSDQQSKEDKQEGEDKEKQQGEDQKNDENQQKEEQDQTQMSKDDAERLLQALAENEKDVQEKVKKAKAAKARVKTLKNW